MNEPWLIAIFATLAVVAVLAAVLLARVAGLARARASELRETIRESAELRARVEAVTTQLANAERDLRQDGFVTRHESGPQPRRIRPFG